MNKVPVNVNDIKKDEWVTLKVMNIDTGVETEEKINFKNFLNRYTSIADFWFHGGRYSVVGKCYDKIYWTIQEDVDTACTDGVHLFFNPLFARQLIQLAQDNMTKEKNKIESEGQNYSDVLKKRKESSIFGLSVSLKEYFTFESSKYFLFVIMHECYHMLYRHIEQAKRKKETANTTSKYIHWLANSSMDLEINRDIEFQWPEFKGCAKESEGCWEWNKYGEKDQWAFIFDERFKNKEEQPDNSSRKEKIIPPFSEEPQGPPPQGPIGGPQIPPIKVEASDDYADGWNKAMEDIENGLIDIDNFNPLPVDPGKFTHPFGVPGIM